MNLLMLIEANYEFFPIKQGPGPGFVVKMSQTWPKTPYRYMRQNREFFGQFLVNFDPICEFIDAN